MSGRVSALAAVLIAAIPLTARAQDLRTKISRDLFTFGTCGQPLCLAGALVGHGEHFIPADTAGGSSVLGFVGNALGAAVGNTPLSSASSGVTFQFVNGIPVKTSTSAGPIYGERAQTLGRGRFFIGANVTAMHFTRLRGVRMDDIQFVFTHQDIPPAGLGDPGFENDQVHVQVAMNINLIVSSLVLAYGIVDGVDLSVDVPVVHNSVQGTSVATIVPFEYPSPHRFAGTDSQPVMTAVASTAGQATGLGDVAARLKLNVTQTQHFGTAIYFEGRFPTGDVNNLLGSGAFSGRGVLVTSATFGTLTPHMNVGYIFRDGELQNNSILATAGFDNYLSDEATLAFDLISDWQLGASKLKVPPLVQYVFPYPHSVLPTNIPDQKDDLLSASMGFKFRTQRGILVVANALFPLRQSGLQPDVIWTAGLEYNF